MQVLVMAKDPALRDVPMSTVDTGVLTVEALGRSRVTVACGRSLRVVDTATDAHAVAALRPHGSFAAAVRPYVLTTMVGGQR